MARSIKSRKKDIVKFNESYIISEDTDYGTALHNFMHIISENGYQRADEIEYFESNGHFPNVYLDEEVEEYMKSHKILHGSYVVYNDDTNYYVQFSVTKERNKYIITGELEEIEVA